MTTNANPSVLIPGVSALGATAALLAALLAAPLAAQQPDFKPAAGPDPVKGWHDPSPLTDDECAMLLLQRAPHATPAGGRSPVVGAPVLTLDRVHFDRARDGELWAAGTTYKASFGRDGFTYVPYLGSDAPRDYPVRFVLRAVRVGGVALPLVPAEPELAGTRVTFARGAVRERYDLRLDQVEQSFVVDSALAGDVEIDVQVISELAEDGTTPGLQFGNRLGCVHYGAAHVVEDAVLRPVETTFDGDSLTIRVTAALRTPAPLVVDPIIRTSAFTYSASGDSAQPDIAYDASSDQYLVVWQHPFSATDIDVWSQFWNGDGTVVPSSLASIDFTTFSFSNPRVANLNASDRFLVVAQRHDGVRSQIYGRLRLAGSAPHPIVFPISDPSVAGDCVNPDIGGDSGNGNRFFVVWEREFIAGTDHDIHGRMVNADISLAPFTLFIEDTASTLHTLPHVSQSNGNGFTASPQWLVVWQFRFSPTDWDVYGAAVAPGGASGTITTRAVSIDASANNDLVPAVSSPATDLGGTVPAYMVTYERQAPFVAMARIVSPVFSTAFVNQITPVDLTQAFGLGGFWVRTESDGCRFAVLSGNGNVTVSTFALGSGGLVLQEAPQVLPTVPFYPRIAAKRSGGGSHTDYGIAFVDTNWFPDRIAVSAYEGRTAGSGIVRRTMACQGLSIGVAGRPFLGEVLTFTLTNHGTDAAAFAFGDTAPATNLLCATCPFGVLLNTMILVPGNALSLTIPCDVALAGFRASVQGLAFGSGPCVASLHTSDTLDLTVR
ncbi:MAG: hypothetical protein IPM29_23520 [Planctomycetes bacterium]|nr:hypothetical protein [Planctomycetota bacterium]